MEARLLNPTGRQAPDESALLRGVVPALLPRMSRNELGLIGIARGDLLTPPIPASAPAEQLINHVRVRARLTRYYLELLPGLDANQRRGVDALCDVATVLHLEPWIRPGIVAEAMRPLREVVGPDDELGFGPACDDVLETLEGIAEFTGSASRVQALTRCWIGHPETYWDGLADTFLATANVTGRESALRMVIRVTAVASGPMRRSPLFRSIRLRAAAVILSDVIEDELRDAASEPWLAGVTAGPTDARA